MNKNKKKLLLHACCGPCLTSSLEQTHTEYEVVPFWYNPNIEPICEHERRNVEYLRFIELKQYEDITAYDYTEENLLWHEAIQGLENELEGGARCQKCIEFRLKRTAEFANKNSIELFSTTLSVSPHKNTEMIKIAGDTCSKNMNNYEHFDFKKEDGYKRSVEISNELELYRQSYCGCEYSIRKKK
jgi:predicted adenine nucleotide alpha hydrolase (AANH) superfamily ATPase